MPLPLTGPRAMAYAVGVEKVGTERALAVRSGTTVGVVGAQLTVETLATPGSIVSEGHIRSLYAGIASRVAASNRIVLFERAFGTLNCADAFAACRDKAFADEGLKPPVHHSYIEGRPCHGGTLAGVQVWSLDRRSVRGSVVASLDGTSAGSVKVETSHSTIVFLSGVTGLDPGSPGSDASALLRMFERAERLLAAHGLGFRSVARTWLHVPNLLDRYETLNQVRSSFFRERGLLDSHPGAFLPASTAVEGRHPSGAPCVLDLLAFRPAELLRPVGSACQGPALEYGSAFSRGMLVRGDSAAAYDGAPLLLVSGTASIDAQGRSVHPGDRAGQITETYRAVDHLLRQAGYSFRDVAQAVRYHRDIDTWHSHEELVRGGLLPDIPALDVLSTICREDLLFEMEVMAGRCR